MVEDCDEEEREEEGGEVGERREGVLLSSHLNVHEGIEERFRQIHDQHAQGQVVGESHQDSAVLHQRGVTRFGLLVGHHFVLESQGLTSHQTHYY